METANYKPQSHEEIRAKILDVAKSIARREGWQAVSINKIAQVINDTCHAVQAHFGTRGELLQEIQEAGFDHLKKIYDFILRRYRDPEKCLYEMSMAQWKFFRQDPETYQVMYNLTAIVSVQPIHQSIMMQEVRDTICKVLFSFIPKSAESIERLYYQWWALSNGIIMLAILGKTEHSADYFEQIYSETVRQFARELR